MSSLISKELIYNSYMNKSNDCIYPCVEEIIKKTFTRPIRILDVGCGSGFILNNLFNQGLQDCYGFDISESGVDLAKKNNLKFPERFFVHDLYDVNLPSGVLSEKFDLVLSAEVIEHLYSPGAYLRNISSWLKQDGYFLLTTPYHGYLKNLFIALFNKSDTHYDPLFEGGHIKFFSKKTLCDLLVQNNFSPVKFFFVGRCIGLWKSMIILAKKI